MLAQNANINLKREQIVIPANGVRPFSCTGQFFLCRDATADFILSIDGNQEIDISPGISFSSPLQFTNLIFRDISGAGVTITFYVGGGGIAYNAPTINVVAKNANTRGVGSGDKVLHTVSTDKTFTGLSVAAGTLPAGLVRKQFVLTNLATVAGTNLILQDSQGNNLMTVYPQQSKTIETSDALWIYNPNGGDISYEVGETFYS